VAPAASTPGLGAAKCRGVDCEEKRDAIYHVILSKHDLRARLSSCGLPSPARGTTTMRKGLLASAFVLVSTLLAQVSPPAQPPTPQATPQNQGANLSQPSQAPPTTDKFGGLTALPSPAGGTGFFRIEEATRGNGSIKRWNFVSPLGNAMYVRGVQN